MSASIPELLGFAPIPRERDKPYSIGSYRAQYILTEDEARKVIATYQSHPAIDLHLSQRYMKDAEYHARVEKAREDISATEPSEEVRRVMRRLVKSMNPPTPEAREAVEEVIGELPEDKDGAA